MKKIQKILYITFSFLIIILASACTPVHDMFSVNKIKSEYESADFTVRLMYTLNTDLIENVADLSERYQDITFSEIPDIDTAYLIEKDEGNSALIVIFSIPGERISSESISLLSGNGYVEYNKNVIICRFKVNNINVTTDTENLDLNNPDVKALYGPLKSAVPDEKKVGF